MRSAIAARALLLRPDLATAPSGGADDHDGRGSGSCASTTSLSTPRADAMRMHPVRERHGGTANKEQAHHHYQETTPCVLWSRKRPLQRTPRPKSAKRGVPCLGRFFVGRGGVGPSWVASKKCAAGGRHLGVPLGSATEDTSCFNPNSPFRNAFPLPLGSDQTSRHVRSHGWYVSSSSQRILPVAVVSVEIGAPGAKLAAHPPISMNVGPAGLVRCEEFRIHHLWPWAACMGLVDRTNATTAVATRVARPGLLDWGRSEQDLLLRLPQ